MQTSEATMHSRNFPSNSEAFSISRATPPSHAACMREEAERGSMHARAARSMRTKQLQQGVRDAGRCGSDAHGCAWMRGQQALGCGATNRLRKARISPSEGKNGPKESSPEEQPGPSIFNIRLIFENS